MSSLRKIPVYDVRLVRARRSLTLAEPIASHGEAAGRTAHAMLGMTDREHFAVLFLDGRMHIVGAHIAAIGGQHGISGLEPRVIFRAAVAACASAVVLAHNHPSGDPSPSREDLAFTKRLMAAGRVLGIPVVDHVIVTRDVRFWHSMQLRGTLPGET